MKKNLKSKVILIIAVLAVCIYGIFGVPSGISGKALIEALTQRIHLGLDLRGGAHLILQVHVEDAVNDETDNTVQEIQQDLKKANLTVSQVYKPDPNQAGCDSHRGHSAGAIERGKLAARRRQVLQRVRPLGRHGQRFDADHEADVREGPGQQDRPAGDRNHQRPRELAGRSEPKIEQYGLGANQILVELPGISDLDRVKTIIQSTARLEIHAVEGGPFPGAGRGLGQRGRRASPEEESCPPPGSWQRLERSVYVLQRAAVVAGSDFRSADPGHQSEHRPAGTCTSR